MKFPELSTRLLVIALAAAMSDARIGRGEERGDCPSSGAQTVMLRQLAPNGELVLADGRIIRMAGLAPRDTEAPLPLDASLTGAQRLRIVLAGSIDRWGRYPAQVFFDAYGKENETWAQGLLLESGQARLWAESAAKPCWSAMLRRENIALQQKTGLWAEKDAVLSARGAATILKNRGKIAMVEGKIIGIGETKTVFYLNFGHSWRKDFVLVILRRRLKSFEDAGLAPLELAQHRVRVRGVVDGVSSPRIELLLPEQLEKLD